MQKIEDFPLTCLDFMKKLQTFKFNLLDCIKFFLFLAAREDQAKAAIAAAMEEWSGKTCIQFKERTNEPHYVTFRFGSGFVL